MVSKIDLGILALGALAVFLIIRGAGQKLDAIGDPLGLGKISLPSLPSLPSISLPSIPNIFAEKSVDPFFTVVEPPRQIVQPEGSTVVIKQGQPPIFVGGTEILDPQGMVVDRPLTLAQLVSQQQSPEEQREVEALQQVQSKIAGQQFTGGGLGFIGGQVTEIPISRLSLNDIIERFGVTASQASDIRARARDDFGGFDFGSNTGSGIGSVIQEIPELRSMLPSLGTISDSEFEGLSAQEIVNRLTGGVISNF